MRKIKPYADDCFKFYEDVIKQKYITAQDPNYKKRMHQIKSKIFNQYKNYDLHFDTNSLQMLKNITFTSSEHNDLCKLYSYKSAIFQELKIKLTTTANNRVINTCQNCTIGEVNSFDHFVPKVEFAEYAVNPKNLIPSCTKCNSHKSSGWRNQNKRLFLNLYIDTLPTEQFLFVKIKHNFSAIGIEYYLEKPQNMDKDLFQLLESHYSKLHLLTRFAENSHDIIAELENSIKSCVSRLSIEESKEIIADKINLDRVVFGFNYWKSILELALVNDSEFMKKYFQ